MNLADLRIARAQARAAWHAASEREHAAFDAWHTGATTTAALDFAAAGSAWRTGDVVSALRLISVGRPPQDLDEVIAEFNLAEYEENETVITLHTTDDDVARAACAHFGREVTVLPATEAARLLTEVRSAIAFLADAERNFAPTDMLGAELARQCRERLADALAGVSP